MLDLSKIARQIRATNEANGFDKPSWDGLLSKIMLAVTELDEAAEAVGVNGAGNLPEELADGCIRLIDVLQSLWPDQWADRRDVPPPGPPWQPIQVALWPALHMMCNAAEAWRYERRDDVRISLELALRDLWRLGARCRFDMEAAIRDKIERNATRGHLHGKARADG